MNDEYINKGKVIAVTAWAAMVALMASAWVVMLASPAHWTIAGMLAAMSCAVACLAATLTIRCYAVRLAGLVRATSGALGEFDRPRPVRDL